MTASCGAVKLCIERVKMKQLLQILEDSLDEKLARIIISNKRKAAAGKKVIVRPFKKKEKLYFKFETYRENQVFHENLEKKEAIGQIERLLITDYKQIEITTDTSVHTALVSKKGKASIRTRQRETFKKLSLSHDRKKDCLLPADEPVPFLVELGVQTKSGKIIDKKYKKYRQINRFLEYVQDVLPRLEKREASDHFGFWLWESISYLCPVPLSENHGGL